MSRVQNPNLEILTTAVEQLGELVFLGGCATGLLITDPTAPVYRWKGNDVILLVKRPKSIESVAKPAVAWS